MTLITEVAERLAQDQSGMVARHQLLADGVGQASIGRALKSGRLRAVHQGVYRVVGAPCDDRQQLWEATLLGGQGAVVSHGSAAKLWNFEAIIPCPPTLTIPHQRTFVARSGLVVHRSRLLEPADFTTDGGLAVTSPARTIVDLSSEYSRARLRKLLEEAHYAKTVRYSQVGQAMLRLSQPGRSGSRLLGEVLDEFVGGRDLEQSKLEHLLATLLDRADVGPWVRQHQLPSLGAVTGTVDAYIEDSAVLPEADGRRWHSRQADLKRDRDREFAAAQCGVLTVRFLHEHLTSDMDGCVAGLREVVARRKGFAKYVRRS